MGHSFRDMPPRFQIGKKEYEGTVRRWRIVERRPRPGDFHPMSASEVQKIMGVLPARFTHGVTTVELLARTGEVGNPFGWYSPRQKSIVLYSLPVGDWLQRKKGTAEGYYEWYGATTTSEGDNMWVRWHGPEHVKFVICWILMHELGHHYDNQYRCRRSYPDKERSHEQSAQAHALRMANQKSIRELFPHIAKNKANPPALTLMQ